MVTKSALAKEIPPYPARLYGNWRRSAARTETTLHQLSPYIGKIKSSIAASLISHFTEEGELVYDPFSGSGTVALEAWLAGRRVIANDLSPYAGLLTRAKLLPYKSLEAALKDIESVASAAIALSTKIDLRLVPCWVQKFFHTDTLREIVAWTTVLRKRRLHFQLSCLMGILHHQRPGFLSFPSSHTVPYLRQKNFPPTQFPELYQYRSLQDRLQAKVRRGYCQVKPTSATMA